MRKWTVKEEEKIIKEAKKHPDNLRYAFEIVSKKIGRTNSAIVTRYYNKLLKTK